MGRFIKIFMWAILVLFLWSSCKNEKPSSDKSLNATQLFTEGKYILEKDNGTSGELTISNVSESEFLFELLAVGSPPAYNQGYMEGQALVSNEQATVETNEYGGVCKISIMKIDSVSVRVETVQGDPSVCGFGNGVVPDGIYRLSGNAGQPLQKLDPAQLNGIWRSTIDPTYELTIAEGKFAEYNRGERVDELNYEFFTDCPQSCFEGTLHNCLRAWNEQDTFCYVVLQLDLKKMELSLIGGTGQSLLFERLK